MSTAPSLDDAFSSALRAAETPPAAAPAPPPAPPPAAGTMAPIPDPPASPAQGPAPARPAATAGASLDGRWTLLDAAGTALYLFQMVDAGRGAEVEGAWRDLTRAGAMNASGVLSGVSRIGDGVEIRFQARGFSTVVALEPDEAGGWRGELRGPGDPAAVTMTRP